MVAIFVVLTIVAFLTTDLIYQKVQRKKAAALAPQAARRPRAFSPESIGLPEGLFFHPGHTWASIMKSGIVKIGLDDMMQKLVGQIDAIQLKRVGDRIKQGEPVLAIRQGNRTMNLVAPVDGIVDALNTDVVKNTGLLKQDPYTAGWLYKVKPTNLSKNISVLKIADSARAWFTEEVARLRDFLSGVSVEDKLVGQTLQDGGIPVEGILQYMNEETWTQFEKEFLAGRE
jgi:glycine cleavage system H lipoate-binding protein